MASPSRRLQTKPVITCLKSVLVTYSFVFWVSAGVVGAGRRGDRAGLHRDPPPGPFVRPARVRGSRARARGGPGPGRAEALSPCPAAAQVSGIILLAVGVWGKVSLEAYFSLLDEKAADVPFVLVGTGTVVILLGTFGCFATCRGNVWMLKLVSGPLARPPVPHVLAALPRRLPWRSMAQQSSAHACHPFPSLTSCLRHVVLCVSLLTFSLAYSMPCSCPSSFWLCWWLPLWDLFSDTR